MSHYQLHNNDCLAAMKVMPDNSVDAVVTDPPYGIRFMGAAWDGKDIEDRAASRRAMESHSPGSGPNGGHKSIAAEAGKYELTPVAMRAFQEFSEEWARQALRILKPGGYLLSFASPRTYHRMTCGIEDAGFEIRDQIMWVFGSGFPKSLDVSKAFDKAAGAQREVIGKKSGRAATPITDIRGGQLVGATGTIDCSAITAPATDAAKKWEGWGTSLKPAHEPICVARKPLIGTVIENILAYGTGAINIDACRVAPTGESRERVGEESQERRYDDAGATNFAEKPGIRGGDPAGRFPANLIHDGSPEVVALFPSNAGAASPVHLRNADKTRATYGAFAGNVDEEGSTFYGDKGGAERFFYCAKASPRDRHEGLPHPGPQFKKGSTLRDTEKLLAAGERHGNHHPTVKPTDLMAYLVRMLCPPGGIVLDPFMGSGSTGKACIREGFRFIGIEREAEYMEIARARIGFEAQRLGLPVLEVAANDSMPIPMESANDETKEAPAQADLFGTH